MSPSPFSRTSCSRIFSRLNSENFANFVHSEIFVSGSDEIGKVKFDKYDFHESLTLKAAVRLHWFYRFRLKFSARSSLQLVRGFSRINSDRNWELRRVVPPFFERGVRRTRGRKKFPSGNFCPRLLPNFADSLSSLMKLELARFPAPSRGTSANYNGSFFGIEVEVSAQRIRREISSRFPPLPIREERGYLLVSECRIFCLPRGYLICDTFHVIIGMLWHNVSIWQWKSQRFIYLHNDIFLCNEYFK